MDHHSKLFLLLAICYQLSLTSAHTIPSGPRKPSPVVLVPGLGGSQGYARVPKEKTPFPLWINLEYINLFRMGTFTSYFKLSYNRTTRRTQDSLLAKITFPGWGDTSMIEYLDQSKIHQTEYFGPLVRRLAQNPFYVRNKTLRGAPFDFRRAPNEAGHFFNNLKLLVEETYVNAGGQRVMLLGHSLGSSYGLYFLKLMSKTWKKKYLRGFMAVSAPIAGAVKSVKCETYGDNLDIDVTTAHLFRPIERSLSSIAFLLPHPKLWTDKEPIVITPLRNYTVNDYKQLFDDMNFEDGYMMRQDTENLIDPVKDIPKVDELHCIHGTEVSTPGQIVYKKRGFFNGKFPDQHPKIVPDDGDGTVNIRSLLTCTKWPGVVHKTFPKADHFGVFKFDNVVDYIYSILERGE